MGCAGSGASSSVQGVAFELDALSKGDAHRHGLDSADLLADALAKDAYGCMPDPSDVLSAPARGTPERTIVATEPHYGWFHGPVHYRIGSAELPSGKEVWLVRLRIAVDGPDAAGVLELSDCSLKSELSGKIHCEGTPYEDAPGLEACPGSGRFEAPATRANARALLRYWSRAAERFWNRDAARYDLPVRYDFELLLADEPARVPVDLRMRLWPSCGRTPYFLALRSGWSPSVLAHELGHYLGLLDEYEALSGITSLYPKTPFEGSEHSRMGVSMKRHTLLYPLHHYLVLRRYHCDEPETRDPYRRVLE